jgi:hypothetical protein
VSGRRLNEDMRISLCLVTMVLVKRTAAGSRYIATQLNVTDQASKAFSLPAAYNFFVLFLRRAARIVVGLQ